MAARWRAPGVRQRLPVRLCGASVLNVSAYLFTRIDDPHALRPVLRERAVAAGLKGTIVLAEEGINLFLAGDPDAVRAFVSELRARSRDSRSSRAARPGRRSSRSAGCS